MMLMVMVGVHGQLTVPVPGVTHGGGLGPAGTKSLCQARRPPRPW